MKNPSSRIADFDSASAMLQALANFLSSKDFPVLGQPPALRPIPRAANRLPRRIRQRLYSVGGAVEAIQEDQAGTVDAEALARWAVTRYPEGRRYPAVAVGSSNGAAIHLCALLGIPWLPQTKLIPIRRRGLHADDMIGDLERGREPGTRLLEANPELQLHHMHDPNQDRLMVENMAYFRVKRLALGRAYEDFIRESLEPGGTIFTLECTLRWPVVRLGPRHFFQPGASGGIEPEEYLRGSPRVAEFLARQGSGRTSWEAPEPDGEAPEAEWGFAPELRRDVERLAAVAGYRVRRVVFEEPEDTSPLVADLYRWSYAERRLLANRLLGATFVLMDPWWTLRTGSVPYWIKFNTEKSAEKLERYLDEREPFDEIHLMLFSHGMESAGFAPLRRWAALLEKARRKGSFPGVDERRFPRDFGVFADYHADLQRITARYPIPGPLPLERLDAFLSSSGDRHPVRWLEASGVSGGGA